MKFAKLIGGGQAGGRLRNVLGSVAVFVALVGGRYALRSWLRDDAPPPPPEGAAMPARSTPSTAGVASAGTPAVTADAKQAPDAKAKPAAKGAPAPAATKGSAKPAEAKAAAKPADAAKTVSVPSQPAPKPAAPAAKPATPAAKPAAPAAKPAAPAAVAKAPAPPAPPAAKPVPAPAAPAPAPKAASATTTQTVATPRQGASPEAASVTIQREVFSYDAGRRRDPFVSLAKPSEVGPLLAELKLIGIAFDEVGRNSVAVLRDQGKGLYRVKIGQSVGRARVATIGRRSVTFNVDEFGVTRQEVMTLRDTTKKGM